MQIWTRRSVIVAGLRPSRLCRGRPPRLGHLYGGLSRPADQPPVVVIPGAFGSSLRDRRTGRELWPVSNSKLLLGNYRELGLPIDLATLEPDASQAEAYAVLREGLGRDFYGGVIDTLERVGGYRRCRRAGAAAHGRPLQSLRLRLRLPARHRAGGARTRGPDRAHTRRARRSRLKVDIVAHSNGGLVARYFVRHGTDGLPTKGALQPSHAGAKAVRRLLLVGTPNLGTLQPVLSLLRGEEIGLRTDSA